MKIKYILAIAKDIKNGKIFIHITSKSKKDKPLILMYKYKEFFNISDEEYSYYVNPIFYEFLKVSDMRRGEVRISNVTKKELNKILEKLSYDTLPKLKKEK